MDWRPAVRLRGWAAPTMLGFRAAAKAAAKAAKAEQRASEELAASEKMRSLVDRIEAGAKLRQLDGEQHAKHLRDCQHATHALSSALSNAEGEESVEVTAGVRLFREMGGGRLCGHLIKLAESVQGGEGEVLTTSLVLVSLIYTSLLAYHAQ